MKLFLNKQITYMKKTILFLSVVVSLMSCGPSNQNPTTVDTKKEGLQSVESRPTQTSKLELLGKYDISSVSFLFINQMEIPFILWKVNHKVIPYQ